MAEKNVYKSRSEIFAKPKDRSDTWGFPPGTVFEVERIANTRVRLTVKEIGQWPDEIALQRPESLPVLGAILEWSGQYFSQIKKLHLERLNQ